MKAPALLVALSVVAIGCGGGSNNKPTPDSGPPRPQCSDGIDNDGDGKIDYPSDPGCFVPQQDSETDHCPDGPDCPQCGNGKDDDGNGMTDFPADPGCTAAGDTDEYTDNPIACGDNLTIHQLPATGSASATFDDTLKFKQLSPCGGGDTTGVVATVYELRVLTPKVIVADTTGSAVTTVLDLRSASCTSAMSEVACSADAMPSITASLQPGTYYLIVESKDNVAGGFALDVQQFAGEGVACTEQSECGPSLVCRVPHGSSTMSCEKPVCSDGRDDDGDGKMDYPTDPGCGSPTDADEADDCPNGPNCPQCANGRDDDNDGATDFPADTSCVAASTPSEASCTNDMDNFGPITGPTATADLATAHHDFTLSCQSSTGNDGSFILVLPVPVKSLTVDTEGSTSTDTVIDLWQGACATSLGCDDDSGTGSLSTLTKTNLAAGTYSVTVAGYSSTHNQAVKVNVHGTLAQGTSCEGALADAGVLACEANTVCRGTAGARTCQPASCNDGLDNDGDGKRDYPEDPGCTSITDDDEVDDCPSGASCPVCANGRDDDGDGKTDYPADPSCASASGTSEASCPSDRDPVTVIAAPSTTSTLAGLEHDHAMTCQSSTGNDAVFTVKLDVAVAALTVDTEGSTGLDSVIAVMDDACTTSLGCDDDSGTDRLSALTLTNLSAGWYSIVVAGYSTSNNLPFQLNVHGTLARGASCESSLVASGVLACASGLACTGTMGSRTCGPAACSDGADNEGDGKADYPDDPGCDSPSDNDETDPATPSVCSNGSDDDHDGTTDYPADLGCVAASGTSEDFCTTETDPVAAITAPTTQLDTTSATNDVTFSCGSAGKSRTFGLRLPVAAATLTLDTEGSTTTDTVLQVSNSACSASLACDDDSGTGSLSLVTMNNVAPGVYAVTVTGYGSTHDGAAKLNVHGTLASGTRCDSALFTSGVLACATGLSCSGTPKTCH